MISLGEEQSIKYTLYSIDYHTINLLIEENSISETV